LISCHSLTRKDEVPVSLQEKIYLNANINIGETVWAKQNERQSKRNPLVLFESGEWKCDLFVYEIILASGFNIGTPNKLNDSKHPELAAQEKLNRPPCSKDWYNDSETKVPGAVLIGEGSEGVKEAIQGDVITDGINIGIYAGNGEIIVANQDAISRTNSWGSNGFGYENIPVKVFRIDSSKQSDITADVTSASSDLKTDNDECDVCYCDTKMDSYLSGNEPSSNQQTPEVEIPATNTTNTTTTDSGDSSGVGKLLYFSILNIFIMLITISFW